MAEINLSGIWNSEYGIQVDDQLGPLQFQHVIDLQHVGDEVRAQSQPQPDGSQLRLDLEHDPERRLLSGSWHETTSPDGRYQGATFKGKVEMVFNEPYTFADGLWIGVNRRLSLIKVGRWTLQRAYRDGEERPPSAFIYDEQI